MFFLLANNSWFDRGPSSMQRRKTLIYPLFSSAIRPRFLVRVFLISIVFSPHKIFEIHGSLIIKPFMIVLRS